MTSKESTTDEEPPAKRNLVIRDMERAEMKGHAELAIEQSDEEATISITTHPPGVELEDAEGEVARIPLDDSLTLDV